jgi:hypothetical protein
MAISEKDPSYYTPEALARAEPVVKDALSTIARPIGNLKWSQWTRPERTLVSAQIVKQLSIPHRVVPRLVGLVLERRKTREIIAVFKRERTLKEAAANVQIPPSKLAEELEARMPHLQRVFDPTRHPRANARQVPLLLFGREQHEHQGGTLRIDKLHAVMEEHVQQLSTDNTEITAYRTATPDDGSQSATRGMRRAH